MITHEVSVIVLEASEGMILTDGETWAEIVYLGKNDSADRWKEVPIEMKPEDKVVAENND